MSDTTPTKPLDDDTRDAVHECDVLFSNWLAARAALFHPDVTDSAEIADRQAKLNEAMRAFMVKPAVIPRFIWRKWEILDELVTDELDGGSFTDMRLVTALGCIKADILRFGFGDPD